MIWWVHCKHLWNHHHKKANKHVHHLQLSLCPSVCVCACVCASVKRTLKMTQHCTANYFFTCYIISEKGFPHHLCSQLIMLRSARLMTKQSLPAPDYDHSEHEKARGRGTGNMRRSRAFFVALSLTYSWRNIFTRRKIQRHFNQSDFVWLS